MKINFNTILKSFREAEIEFHVYGHGLNPEKLCAIDYHVDNALCYYVGDNILELDNIQNSIIICQKYFPIDKERNNTLIVVDNPQLCFYIASHLFENNIKWKIDKRSIIDSNASIGKFISIGPFCYIEESIIGDEVVIESGVKIKNKSVIGDRVSIQSNTVIGATGVMWTWDKNGNKILCSQTGGVIIEDDVFIGSNITIVRGSFTNSNTIIGKGSMLAHGTMIGHGAKIGPGSHFANNVSIAGSVESGSNCFFGSGSILRPHVKIANDTIVGAGAVVVNDFNQIPGLVLVGNPARPLAKKKNSYAGVPSKNY